MDYLHGTQLTGGRLAKALVAVLVASCSGPLTHRIVESPAGESVTLGAPRDWTYATEVLPEHDALTLRVTRAARCDRIPVTVMNRVDEAIDGDEVVSRKPLSPRQSSGTPQGDAECEKGYATDSDVALKIGENVFELGKTDRAGVVRVDLSDRLELSLYGEAAPAEATVMVRGPKALESTSGTTLPLTSLAKHEAYVRAQLKQMSGLLTRDTPLTNSDAQRLFVLYERLRRIAPENPDFKGSTVRFWEIVRERKQAEAARSFTRNLKALNEARDLLKGAGVAALPVYVRAAVSDGNVALEAIEWAELELLSGVVNVPAVCAGRFSWAALPNYGLDPEQLLAARYLQFAYGNGYERTANGYCKRFRL